MSSAGNGRVSPARLALAVRELRAQREDLELIASDPIAVIGMSCRFPAQGSSPEAFWSALIEGRCGFVEMPDHRWKDKAGLQREHRIGGYLDRIDGFDTEYFGISPREAAQMDPQQRLLLEVAWEALWDAGLEPGALAGTNTGVFAAIYNSDYARMLFQNRSALTAHAGIGTAHSIAAGRLAFLLDIKGPNVVVDSACSSSLVATHMAVQSLRAQECATAIVGASSLKILPDEVVVFTKWGMLAHDGRCKTFDAAADGFIPGEGCGVIILRRLADALRDGDRIRAVIRGSAVNQDGRSTVLTAPNGLSQQAVIRAALANARIEPDEVSYVETHGTGTSLGDPIEVEALQSVYGAQADGLPPCMLGAVKTNVGHLEAAAGIAGIIKTVLCLENQVLPKNLHFERLNPQIQLDGSRLALLTQSTPWPRGEKARVAGVSSFGLGGTNAHIVLEEAPVVTQNRAHANGRVIPIPRREWSRQRCWLPETVPSMTRDGYVHPLLGRPLGTAFVQGRLFQSELAAASTRYLADHRLANQAIVPFAAFLEIAHAAAEEVRSNSDFAIRNFMLQDPLFLSATSRSFQVLVNGNRIEIASELDSGWLQHGSADLHPAEAVHEKTDLDTLRARFPNEIDPGEIYRRLESSGLTYGPSFRVIEKAWSAPGESVALLQLPKELHTESGEYGIHPVLLDGCLQTVMAVLNALDAELFLPFAVDDFQILRNGVTEVWVHSQILNSSPDLITARIVVMDRSGQQVALLGGFQAKRTSISAIGQPGKSAPVYELAWRARPLPPQGATSRRDEKWLLLEAKSGSCAELADALSTRGAVCTIARIQDAPQLLFEAAWSAVLYDARRSASAAGDASWHHPERPSIEFMLAFAKRFASTSADGTPRLWVRTSFAAALVPDENVSLTLAPLVGMLRTLGIEQSAAAPVLIDTSAAAPLDDHESIIKEIDANTGESMVAVRGSTRYVARIVPQVPQAAQSRRLSIADPGRLDDLTFEPLVRTVPAAHEVEIEVRATGLNFRDVLNALGMFDVHDPKFGAECAGTVTRVGDRVSDLMPGLHVMAFAPFGFQSYVNVHRQYVVALPDGMSFAEGAGIPVAFLTAWYGLHTLAGLSAGDKILIHAATGGLGQAALQLAKHAGAVIYATAGNEDKREFLRSQGIHHVFDSRSLSFRSDVLEATGGAGVDVVLNSLADDFIAASLETVARDGCFLEVGKRGIWTHEQVSTFRSDIRYFPFDLGDIAIQDPNRIAEMLRELTPRFAAGQLHPMKTTIYPIEGASQAFRTMAQAAHVGKIVLTHGPREQDSLRGILSEGTVLITGGLGALGAAVAGWLAQMGARHLVLCSRHAEDDHPAAVELRKQGITVTVERVDVASVEQMEKLLSRIRSELPPLSAVFHAAGIVQDAMLNTEDWASYVTATAAKIEGAWNLHRLTRRDPVKLMVFFSSAASVLGSAGQGSYAAANAFLDGLAHVRSSQGMQTCSVNWGAWGAAGMAARLAPEHSARWQRQGVHPMEASAALAALEKALRSKRPQAIITDNDWERLVASRASRDASFFEELAKPRDADSAGASAERDPLPDFLEVPVAERKPLLARHIRNCARKILSMDAASPIQDDVPLQDIGLDSLMALEMRNELAQSLGLTLAAGLLFNYPTVTELAGHLLSRLPNGEMKVAQESTLNNDELKGLEALTDEEAEQLLIKELDGSGEAVHG